jgi:hypothetical protein
MGAGIGHWIALGTVPGFVGWMHVPEPYAAGIELRHSESNGSLAPGIPCPLVTLHSGLIHDVIVPADNQ